MLDTPQYNVRELCVVYILKFSLYFIDKSFLKLAEAEYVGLPNDVSVYISAILCDSDECLYFNSQYV